MYVCMLFWLQSYSAGKPNGIYIGVEEERLKLIIDGKYELFTDALVDNDFLNSWHSITATLNHASGAMEIHVDGSIAAKGFVCSKLYIKIITVFMLCPTQFACRFGSTFYILLWHMLSYNNICCMTNTVMQHRFCMIKIVIPSFLYNATLFIQKANNKSQLPNKKKAKKLKKANKLLYR